MDRIATLNEILTENPKDAFARYGLAMEYSKQGDFDRAPQAIAHQPRLQAGLVPAGGQKAHKRGRDQQQYGRAGRAEVTAGVAGVHWAAPVCRAGHSRAIWWAWQGRENALLPWRWSRQHIR